MCIFVYACGKKINPFPLTFRRKWCIIEAVKLFDYTLILGGLSHTGEFSNGVYPIFLP
nr:MAG TPA: hypothetical protein [Caudoviricetes sp.]